MLTVTPGMVSGEYMRVSIPSTYRSLGWHECLHHSTRLRTCLSGEHSWVAADSSYHAPGDGSSPPTL